ncbi:pyruvate ferredoxin oxidoreductase delta subunit [Candidatus Hakubella thermalkaliphila]|uniref:Pyruvate ferredoxin oxidoreductase delta subunit n=2 Tax=Candidatus Hakubella thermalkaliphila TaxID=2754717 RepID=A0A6V8NI76_9ACTN|nr:4Fe-4S binding protein [Candidatus Hakubella thermalkaliphila]MBT9171310.1 Pyruvate synthase subunit PorD [Actinomycetota bacterium]GFP20032.1 pyruvate ferredoxin oxidoreductase delta subunit [Candidatus Hakubella thermalkaliphila]GFP25927.1 pyruvate ferredoxin oxidoreductase delta subunit [Candidatus Hakubella thermalkaliphila]GFP27258.1 pyruvate ferredoxin oxidoreductase delta subunit [Candidatus Hakubella thermalkaliphila]GFP30461.1 pyruvate ferredoxin oxidoreductase delta subunit [Candi
MYVAVKLEDGKCTGCKLCIFICPEPNVLKFSKEVKKVAVNEGRCKGCGLCVTICPKEALASASIGN